MRVRACLNNQKEPVMSKTKKVPMKQILSCLTIMLLGTSVSATGRYVDTAGSDSSDCSDSLSPCATLQYAVNQSVSLDTINISAGTYSVSGVVTINKTLTILGAQAGVDARTRLAAETVLSNSQGISVSANNVTFDGLTIQDSNIAAFTGYGIWLNPSIDGTTIVNTIFQNNIVGLGLANAGASQCLIQYNLFQNNNQPGGAFGTGIYTDEYVGGSVSNVLISDNRFESNENAGIGLSNNTLALSNSDFTITNNIINNCGRGIYIYNTIGTNIISNTITNLSAPTDGGSSVALGIYGGNSNLSALQNNFNSGARYGVRIGAFLAANSDILIHDNNISGYATAGLLVNDAPIGPTDFATCNWWGDASGPYNASLNPAGAGDEVSGTLVLGNFSPWLLEASPEGSCGSAPSVEVLFSPTTIYEGKKSNLTITFVNPNDSAATITALFTNYLPSGLSVSGSATNTCGGSLTAISGSSSFSLSGGIIAANSSCKIKVQVTASHEGNYTNVVPTGALQTNKGSNADPAEATLVVLSKNGPLH